jgi:hypothetical protein
MKSGFKYVTGVLATGFVCLVLLSVLLFWGRQWCQKIFYENVISRGEAIIEIKPSGLTPDLDSNPDLTRQSIIKAQMTSDVVAGSLGITQDIWSLEQGKLGEFNLANLQKEKSSYEMILFDEGLGLFVYYDVFREKKGWDKTAKLYAGPEGVSEKTDKGLGRFSRPRKELCSGGIDCFIFFDESHRCFFQVVFWQHTAGTPDKKPGTVVKGPKVFASYKFVQLGNENGFDKNGDMLGLEWQMPVREGPYTYKEGDAVSWSDRYFLVLEEDGTIRRLDTETLEVSSRVAGGLVGPAKAKDFLAYKVLPIGGYRNGYVGTVVGVIAREAYDMRVMVFDKEGKLVSNNGWGIDAENKPGGVSYVAVTYMLDSMQGFAAGLASYFCGSVFEATDGHRAIFILPNSWPAGVSRAANGPVTSFFATLILLLPSIMLGVFLAWRVGKDAVVVGVPKRARQCWVIGTILFGLSGYLTYRLVRYRETLVTCENCGRMRRVDMAHCHRCGSKWIVPELAAPAWRVVS